MVNIIKKDGRKVKFEIKKVKSSIQKAFIDAGLCTYSNADKIDKITKSIAKLAKEKENFSTKQVKTEVLKSLNKVKVAACKAWKKFDAKYKK